MRLSAPLPGAEVLSTPPARGMRERLGVEADEITGGHIVALSNPVGLAAQLHAYAAQLRTA